MTRSDKWKQRPEVVAFRAWADQVRIAAGSPFRKLSLDVLEIHIRATFPFPKSYSQKERARLAGNYHRVKPDADNVLKGIADALLENDSCVAEMTCQKYWCLPGEEPSAFVKLVLAEG